MIKRGRRELDRKSRCIMWRVPRKWYVLSDPDHILRRLLVDFFNLRVYDDGQIIGSHWIPL